MNAVPYPIELPQIGTIELGFLSYIQPPQIPFLSRRAYWVYEVPEEAERGAHAHRKLQQVLFCLRGGMFVESDDGMGHKALYELSSPSVGLYMPPWIWHTFRISGNGIMLALASDDFNEEDYIRNYDDFVALAKAKLL